MYARPASLGGVGAVAGFSFHAPTITSPRPLPLRSTVPPTENPNWPPASGYTDARVSSRNPVAPLYMCARPPPSPGSPTTTSPRASPVMSATPETDQPNRPFAVAVGERNLNSSAPVAVSYTHLTLPTSDLV